MNTRKSIKRGIKNVLLHTTLHTITRNYVKRIPTPSFDGVFFGATHVDTLDLCKIFRGYKKAEAGEIRSISTVEQS